MDSVCPRFTICGDSCNLVNGLLLLKDANNYKLMFMYRKKNLEILVEKWYFQRIIFFLIEESLFDDVGLFVDRLIVFLCFYYFDFMVFVLFHYLLYSNDAIIIYLTLKEKKKVSERNSNGIKDIGFSFGPSGIFSFFSDTDTKEGSLSIAYYLSVDMPSILGTFFLL